MGNDHFCDTTERASQRLFSSYKGGFPCITEAGRNPLIPQPCFSVSPVGWQLFDSVWLRLRGSSRGPRQRSHDLGGRTYQLLSPCFSPLVVPVRLGLVRVRVASMVGKHEFGHNVLDVRQRIVTYQGYQEARRSPGKKGRCWNFSSKSFS